MGRMATFLVPEDKIFSGAALILYSNDKYLDALTYKVTAISKPGPIKLLRNMLRINNYCRYHSLGAPYPVEPPDSLELYRPV